MQLLHGQSLAAKPECGPPAVGELDNNPRPVEPHQSVAVTDTVAQQGPQNPGAEGGSKLAVSCLQTDKSRDWKAVDQADGEMSPLTFPDLN